MVKLVKVSPKNDKNYFIDSISGAISFRHDIDNPNQDLLISLDDDTKLYIENKNIKKVYGNVITFLYNNDKYIVQDDYQNILVKSGYIIWDGTDNIKGIALNKIISDDISKALSDYPYTIEKDENNSNIYNLITYDDNYKYIVKISPVSNIIQANINRKDNGLTFYPYDKNIDKFSSYYLAIFAEKLDEYEDDSDYMFIDDFMKNIMRNINLYNQYHFVDQLIKKYIIYCEGI